MKGKLLLLAGAAVGYVFGTRAGRERYEQLKANVNKAWHDPRVQEKVTEAEHFVSEKAPHVQEKLSETARGAVDAARSKFGNGEQEEAALTPDSDQPQPSRPTPANAPGSTG
jgi:hypothetical protein